METWQDIKDFEGHYKISDCGRVKSVKRFKNGTERNKILKVKVRKDGYEEVNLQKKGKNVHARIHRLVAQAFIPNSDNKPQINHRNGIKTDNKVSNLEWVTASENGKHAYETGLSTPPKLTNKHKQSLKKGNYVKVQQFSLDGSFINSYNSILEASEVTRTPKSTISANIRGSVKHAGGSVWVRLNYRGNKSI